MQEGGGGGRGGAVSGEGRLNAKLEELRNLQDRFTKEKTEWNKDRDNQEKWIQGKRTELAKLQVRSGDTWRCDMDDGGGGRVGGY